MKPVLVFGAAMLLLASPIFSDPETAPSQPRWVPMATQAPRAWLGLRVAKPDETITAHVPLLPQGIGFVVKSVESGGPAEAAGLAEFDLVWKLDDQKLVNEAQLAALLRLSKPGEEVVLALFRGGKPLDVRLTLGEAPVLKKPFSGELVESALLPGAGAVPMRVVSVAQKSASFSDDEGKGVVRRNGDAYYVQIRGPKDENVFDGDVAKGDNLDRLPEEWRRKIQVLCRSLDQALEGELSTPRQPRPRVVPPAPASH